MEDAAAPAADEIKNLPTAQPPKRPGAIASLWRAFNPPKDYKPIPCTLPLPSPTRRASSLTESAFDPTNRSSQPDTILYLAYGSNLCHETFQGRRGIRPIAAINVLVPSLKLTFDLPGIPYSEPCFANSAVRTDDTIPNPDLSSPTTEDALAPLVAATGLQDEDSDHSHPLIGVVYEVTSSDYAHIIATEGPTYADVVVRCTALPTPSASSSPLNKEEFPDQPFNAHTLLAPPSAARHPPSGKPAQPSLRYLNLCRSGAAEHSLPAAWQAYLNGLQHYHPTSRRQQWGRKVFMAAWMPALGILFGLRRKVADDEGKSPAWITRLTGALFKAMWISYDWVYHPIFGEGERTERTRKEFSSML